MQRSPPPTLSDVAGDVGSEWRKWDLHIHTPASHTASYGATPACWDRYLKALSDLPAEISVIGINDYMWVDGYERVLAHKADGYLPNIAAVFPVIELRLRDFIGTTGKLSRLNAHVIFAPGTRPDLITAQFVNALTTSFQLTDEYEGPPIEWKALPTPESLEELGRKIKASIPASELTQYDSDFQEGFNAWVIPLEKVDDALNNSSFAEKPLLALGKTEWEDIPWANNTIGAKKSLISKAQLLFTAAASPAAWELSVERLRVARVNHRVLDCSDAHHYADSDEKDKLGNCSTWVCADPTLAGLRHALIEFRSRVYVGEKPPLLVRKTGDPTQFVGAIQIRPVDPANTPSPGFDISLPVNPALRL